jgi:hypothetical protein
MAFGDLTRQLAQQALRSTTKEVVDALRPPDLSQIAESLQGPGGKAAASSPGEQLHTAILGQVQAMQRALKEDEELVVLLSTATETLRVLEFFVPSPALMVLNGIDTEKNVTRVITPVAAVQLVCKVMKVQPPVKPVRIGFVVPKPKPE